MVRSILVSGATGKQGGAVVKALLALSAEIQILALTRYPQKKSAQTLLKISPRIKLIEGNLDDPKHVFQKIKEVTQSPVWGVFSVQPIYIGPGADTKLEERQGKALIDAALDNNVKCFVYSSVDRGGVSSDHEPTNIPHFISKHNIEQYLQERARGTSMNWTILRPVAFFENLVPGFMGKVFATSLKQSLKGNRKLQFVATSDIGCIAALCFVEHERFKYQKLSLAGDELTYAQFKQIFKETTGQKLPTTFRLVTSLLNMVFGELGRMFKWFRNHGYDADIFGLRQMHPGLRDFRTWLKEESQFVIMEGKAPDEMTQLISVTVVK